MIEILPYLKEPKSMGSLVYSFLWVMQDLYHPPYLWSSGLILLVGYRGGKASATRVHRSGIVQTPQELPVCFLAVPEHKYRKAQSVCQSSCTEPLSLVAE